MKTYLTRIEKKETRGKIWFQPQIKRKSLFSFLFSWIPLSMLILDMNLSTSDLKTWSDNEKDVQDTLDRFQHIANVNLEQIKN